LDRHTESRLKKDLVAWLVTADGDGRPHAVPIWFLWDGREFLIYSVPGRKVRDIEANPHVAMHLNSDPEGGDVVRLEGTAKVMAGDAGADKTPAYLRKYREQIRSLGMTPRAFAEQYHVAIRLQPARIHE